MKDFKVQSSKFLLFTVHCLLFTVFIPAVLSAANNPPSSPFTKGGQRGIISKGGEGGFAQSVDEIVDKVQATYEHTSDLEATFLQESLIKTMDTIEKSEGKVYIKKPGKMRWDYKKPRKQEIVIEGKTIWIYKPDEKQVLKTPFSDNPQNKTPAGFLSGVGRLKDDFKIRLHNPPSPPYPPLTKGGIGGGKGGQEGIFTLELIPKGIKSNIEKIFLEVNPEDYTIRSFSLFDIYGNKTTVTLKNIKTNKGLKDSTFHFKVPEGVKVIE